ncbi:hypothetical protein FOA52_008681 [Chlamydomonas sp. UWO 241]|nr:hypothetical protein FOA52_008681 [Chlamydomonas sp. UWO 241]
MSLPLPVARARLGGLSSAFETVAQTFMQRASVEDVDGTCPEIEVDPSSDAHVRLSIGNNHISSISSGSVDAWGSASSLTVAVGFSPVAGEPVLASVRSSPVAGGTCASGVATLPTTLALGGFFKARTRPRRVPSSNVASLKDVPEDSMVLDGDHGADAGDTCDEGPSSAASTSEQMPHPSQRSLASRLRDRSGVAGDGPPSFSPARQSALSHDSIGEATPGIAGGCVAMTATGGGLPTTGGCVTATDTLPVVCDIGDAPLNACPPPTDTTSSFDPLQLPPPPAHAVVTGRIASAPAYTLLQQQQQQMCASTPPTSACPVTVAAPCPPPATSAHLAALPEHLHMHNYISLPGPLSGAALRGPPGPLSDPTNGSGGNSSGDSSVGGGACTPARALNPQAHPPSLVLAATTAAATAASAPRANNAHPYAHNPLFSNVWAAASVATAGGLGSSRPGAAGSASGVVGAPGGSGGVAFGARTSSAPGPIHTLLVPALRIPQPAKPPNVPCQSSGGGYGGGGDGDGGVSGASPQQLQALNKPHSQFEDDVGVAESVDGRGPSTTAGDAGRVMFRGMRLKAAVISSVIELRLDPSTGHMALNTATATQLNKLLSKAATGQVLMGAHPAEAPGLAERVRPQLACAPGAPQLARASATMRATSVASASATKVKRLMFSMAAPTSRG